MKNDYTSRRNWSDNFTPKLCQLVADYYGCRADDIKVTDRDTDIRDGVDVELPTGENVGLRVRKYDQLAHADQFTVRLTRNQYGDHELDKIKAGKLDSIIYGFATEAASGDELLINDLCLWHLLDMRVFRAAADVWFSGVRHQLVDLPQCQFLAFNIDDFDAHGRIVLAADTID